MANRVVKLFVLGAVLGASNVASALPPCNPFCQCEPLIRCAQQCTLPGGGATTCGNYHGGLCDGGAACRVRNPDNFLDAFSDDALCEVDETVPAPEEPKPEPAANALEVPAPTR